MSGIDVLIEMFLLFGAWAGIWVWTVKQRGEWNLVFANFAGAFAGLIVGSLLLILYDAFVGLPTHPNAGRSIPVFLAIVGVAYGPWKLISRGNHPPMKQLLLHLGGGLAGFAGVFFATLVLTPYLRAGQ